MEPPPVVGTVEGSKKEDPEQVRWPFFAWFYAYTVAGEVGPGGLSPLGAWSENRDMAKQVTGRM